MPFDRQNWTAHDGDAFIVGFGTIIGVRWGGFGIQEVSAGLSNNPSRSDREGSVSAAASVAICFGFDLFVSENPGRADQRCRVVMNLQGGCPLTFCRCYFGGEAVVGVVML